MSHCQGNTHDPVIDRVNDSDEDEVSSTPGQDPIDLVTPQDNASLLSAFNGDALGADGSLHFKKGYNGNPLEVSVTPSLDDGPLPLEPVSLNPFAMDIEPLHHHNSPLPSRSEQHNFNVSVSDSLPPLVMELDSPEHSFGDPEIDEEEDCDDDIGIFKEAPKFPGSAISDFAISSKLFEAEPKKSPSRLITSECDAERLTDKGITTSQGDLFGSQQAEDDADADPSTPFKENVSLKDNEETAGVLPPDSEEQSQYPPTLSPSNTTEMPFHTLHSISPKRKRDDNLQEDLGIKAPKLETHSCIGELKNSDLLHQFSSKLPVSLETSDNEIEIIDDLSQRDESIEVLYDRKESEQGETQEDASQDIRLIFTGTSQSQSETCSFAKRPDDTEFSSRKKFDAFIQDDVKEGSQSQSLLTMPSSDNLLCDDSLSLSPTDSQPIEGTMRATQVEALCQTAVHLSQPDIEPLLKYPILDKPQQSSNTSNSNTSTKFSDHDLERSHSATSHPTQEANSPLFDESPQKSPSHSPNHDGASSICMPHFETPMEDATEEQSESVFMKATEAAKKKLEQERSNMKGKPPETDTKTSEKKDSFENGSHIPELSPSDRESLIEETASYPSTPADSFSLVPSSQSTPVSSHVSESAVLFTSRCESHVTNKDSLQNSNVLAEDSDEESGAKRQLKPPQPYPLSEKLKREVKKTSTPNQETVISPNISEGGSYIDKDDTLGSKVSEPSHRSPRHPGESDTQEIEVNPIKTVSDLICANFHIHLRRKMEVEFIEWRDTDGNTYFARPGEEKVYKDIVMVDMNNPAIDSFSSSSSGSGRGRISDVSTISRFTTSSGYFGDKSNSSEGNSTGASFFHPDVNRLESTRHSIGSVAVISPPRQIPNDVTSISDACDEVTYFQPPRPVKTRKPLIESPSHPEEVKSSTKEHQSLEPEKKFVSIGIQTDTDVMPVNEGNTRARRGRGRGRPRGRSRGLLRATNLNTAVVEEESEIERLSPVKVADIPTISKDKAVAPSKETVAPHATSVQGNEELKGEISSQLEKTDDYLSKLPKDLVERLKSCHIATSEDENEFFQIQQQNSHAMDDDKHKAHILKKIREVDLKPDLLVFARYFDSNFYSAVIVSEAKTRERWDVEYNLDKRQYTVLEVNILPTYILPRGCFCYVRHHTGDFCDPGTVRGHLFENDLLLHLIETHRGTIVKVPHSHLQLKAAAAEEMLHSRRSFRCLVSSPGRDISLDNVIPKERPRKATLSSYTKGQASSESTSPPKSSVLPKPRKVDANLDTSSGTEGYISKKSNKSGQKRKGKAVVAVPGSSDTETDEQSPPKAARRKLPTTPKTPKSVINSPQFSPSSRIKTPVTKFLAPKRIQVLKADSPSKIPIQEAIHPHDNLLKNPVVELIQLEQVAASPKASTKKRGRKPNSSGKTPRKLLKLSNESEEDSSDIERKLGPLPPGGSKLFQGYFIMITSSTAAKQKADPGENDFPPLDKSHLTEQITRGGGTVLESFDKAMEVLTEESNARRAGSASVSHNKADSNKEIESREKKLRSAKTMAVSASPTKLICLSNTHCRTEKFIRCLAVGIPLVSSYWIITSCLENSCKNWTNYLLPAGMSLLTGNIMEQSFSDKYKDTFSSVGQVVEVLKGEKVFLASSENPSFTNLWLTLLTAAQAQVFTMSVKSSLARLIDRRTSVVVADSTIPVKELDRARSIGIPVVSTEWFIQSLIARCKLQYDAHREFQHDYRKVEVPEER